MDTKNALAKHQANVHPNSTLNFNYKVHSQWKTSRKRQIGEAIEIYDSPPETLMDSMSEWRGNRIPRIQVATDDKPEDGGPYFAPTETISDTRNLRVRKATILDEPTREKRPRMDKMPVQHTLMSFLGTRRGSLPQGEVHDPHGHHPGLRGARSNSKTPRRPQSLDVKTPENGKVGIGSVKDGTLPNV